MEAMLEESLMKWVEAHPPAPSMQEAEEFATNQDLLDMLVEHAGDAPMLTELNKFMTNNGYLYDVLPGTHKLAWLLKC